MVVVLELPVLDAERTIALAVGARARQATVDLQLLYRRVHARAERCLGGRFSGHGETLAFSAL